MCINCENNIVNEALIALQPVFDEFGRNQVADILREHLKEIVDDFWGFDRCHKHGGYNNEDNCMLCKELRKEQAYDDLFGYPLCEDEVMAHEHDWQTAADFPEISLCFECGDYQTLKQLDLEEAMDRVRNLANDMSAMGPAQWSTYVVGEYIHRALEGKEIMSKDKSEEQDIYVRLEKMEKAIEHVRIMHTNLVPLTSGAVVDLKQCNECAQEFPCATIKALDGEQ